MKTSKMTVVENQDGTIAAIVHGPAVHKSGDVSVGVRGGPNQKVHEIDVEEDVASLRDPEELQKRLKERIKKAK